MLSITRTIAGPWWGNLGGRPNEQCRYIFGLSYCQSDSRGIPLVVRLLYYRSISHCFFLVCHYSVFRSLPPQIDVVLMVCDLKTCNFNASTITLMLYSILVYLHIDVLLDVYWKRQFLVVGRLKSDTTGVFTILVSRGGILFGNRQLWRLLTCLLGG